MRVAVLDRNKKPLAPTTPRRAKLLLRRGKAAVFRRVPFVIILRREVENVETPDLKLKIDPGSKTTGLAIINQRSGEIVFAAEIEHRGEAIKREVDARRAVRRSRRSRKTRYRKPRFLNRTRPKEWLPPSLKSRVSNIETWVNRITRFYPISGISVELVKVDTQLMENPEIKGVEYQQGELAGYELKEYLLLKFGHQCAYRRDESPRDHYLQVEHIIPRARGGTNRVSNLTIACHKHNQEKGNRTAAEYGFPEVEAQAKRPLKDGATVNATRWALFNRLKGRGLPLETGSGGLTKFNRTKRGLPKAHWIDAACVGKSTPEQVIIDKVTPLEIKATGHNSRQMCRMDKYGFPRTSAKGPRTVKGFRTGDIVRANILSGKYAGQYTGRIAVRSRGSFVISTNGTKFDIHHRYCSIIYRADGYSVSQSRSGTISNSSPSKPLRSCGWSTF
jgi:5-methylcytosine-specific restriction endonuclease McrA